VPKRNPSTEVDQTTVEMTDLDRLVAEKKAQVRALNADIATLTGKPVRTPREPKVLSLEEVVVKQAAHPNGRTVLGIAGSVLLRERAGQDRDFAIVDVTNFYAGTVSQFLADFDQAPEGQTLTAFGDEWMKAHGLVTRRSPASSNGHGDRDQEVLEEIATD
jgi:hypothetical protein